jgi:hypothetical protein
MPNKYLYLFFKDLQFRALCIFSIAGLAGCLLLTRLCIREDMELRDLKQKQLMVADIPWLQSQILQKHKSGEDLFLNGIILSQKHPMAIINHAFYKVGDVIEGKVVKSITARHVNICNVETPDKCITLQFQE